jgi:hypothetical protein
MSAVQLRGGAVVAFRETVDGTGRAYVMPFATFWMKFRNKGAAVVQLYFNATDFAGGTNYVELPIAAATAPHGEWEGPVEVDTYNGHKVWLKSASGSNVVEIVAFQRRG